MALFVPGTLATVGDIVQIPVANAAAVGIDLSGTFAGVTAVLEGSRNKGLTWASVSVLVDKGAGVYSSNEVSSVTAAGKFTFPAGGFTHFRIRLTAITSGTVVVGLNATRAAVSRDTTVIKQEATATVIQTTTSDVTVSAAPTYLLGVHIVTALVGTVTIKGLLDDAGAARSWVIPASFVGNAVSSGNALRFETNLIVNCSSASDAGKVLIVWRAI